MTRRKATIFDPIPVGRYADGELAFLIVATPDGGLHCLIVGMTGSGKTFGEKPVLLHCAALGCDQILIDTVKGIQSFGSMAGVLQMYEINPARVTALIQRLKNYTLPARTAQLAREGLTAWSPRSSLRFLRVHLEEAWDLLEVDELNALGVALRSAGGQLTVSVQRSTHDQMTTLLRGQMSTVRCYGVKEAADAGYALSEEIMDAGANPAKWKNHQPGMHYLERKGLTLEQMATPIRSWTDAGATTSFAEAAARIGASLGEMDRITRESLGDLWTSRVPPLELVKQFGSLTPGPVTRRVLAAVPQDAPAQVPVTVHGHEVPPLEWDSDAEGDSVDVRVDMAIHGRQVVFSGYGGEMTMYLDEDDPDPAFTPNPHAPITARSEDRDELVFGPVGAVKASPEMFEQAMLDRLEQLWASESITAADFAGVIAITRWSRGSVYARLNAWKDQGWLGKLPGERGTTYLPVPGAGVPWAQPKGA